MAKKGLAVFHSSDLTNPVHKLMDDGVAELGKSGKTVTLKGDVMVTVANYASTLTLSEIINSIKSAYEAGDTTLQTNIDNEATARTDGDASLTARVAAEESARATADSSLEVVIAALQADVDQNEADADAAM